MFLPQNRKDLKRKDKNKCEYKSTIQKYIVNVNKPGGLMDEKKG